MLNEIKEALEAKFPDLPVYYGSNMEASGKRIFDHIVFFTDHIAWKPNSKGDLSVYYKVMLVHQNYIPEDEYTAVVDALRDVPGLKETNDDIDFEYYTQPGTQLALEVARYTFVAARKRIPAKVVVSDGS